MQNQLKNKNYFPKQNLVLLSFLSLGLFFNSCHLCYDEGSYLVEEEIKAYTLFPIGSWWVYENVETSEQDTAKVLATASGWYTETHYDRETQWIRQSILRQGVNRKTEINSYPLDEGMDSFYTEWELEGRVPVNLFSRLSFPLQYTDTISSDVFHAHETLDSTEIAGQTFYDIIETRLDTQRTVFSRGVGIIAITYEDGSSYVLKDYFIEE